MKEYTLITERGFTRNQLIRRGLRYLEFEFDAIEECALSIDAGPGDKELAKAVATIREYLNEVISEE